MASVTCPTCGEPSQGQEGRDRVTGHCARCVLARAEREATEAHRLKVSRERGFVGTRVEEDFHAGWRAALAWVMQQRFQAALAPSLARTSAEAQAPTESAHDEKPIGHATNVQQTQDGLTATLTFTEEEIARRRARQHAHQAMEVLDQAEHLPDELSSDDLSAIEDALVAAFDAGREVRLEAPNTTTQQAREAGADAELVRITTLLRTGVQDARRKAERLADDAKRETRHADMLEAAFTEIELDRLLREGK